MEDRRGSEWGGSGWGAHRGPGSGRMGVVPDLLRRGNRGAERATLSKIWWVGQKGLRGGEYKGSGSVARRRKVAGSSEALGRRGGGLEAARAPVPEG